MYYLCRLKIKKLYEKDTIITNTLVPLVGAATHIGSVCYDSGGDEAGTVCLRVGDV